MKMKATLVVFAVLSGIGAILKIGNAWSAQLLPYIGSCLEISSVGSFYLYTACQLIFVILSLFLFARSRIISKFEFVDLKRATERVACYIAIIAFAVTFSDGSIPDKDLLSAGFISWMQFFFTPVEAYLIPVYLLYGRRTIWDAAYGNASFLCFLPSIGFPYLFLHAVKKLRSGRARSDSSKKERRYRE